MTSQVIVANLALSHLATGPISSLDDNSPTAKKIKMVYDIALESSLQSHAWSFANRHIALSQLANESIVGWDYLYIYPSDCVHLRKIYQEDTYSKEPPEKFEEVLSPITQTKSIATNIEQAYAKYTARITDHSKFTADFVEAFSLYLASMIAQPVTGDAKVAASVFAMYRFKIDEAKKRNMSEKQTMVSSKCSFIDAR